jgi:hypothetical protein
MGRILVPVGILSGVMGVIFGFFFSFGGSPRPAPQSSSAPGSHSPSPWDDPGLRHRARSGTIRIWVGIFQATGLLGEVASFGAAFWISWTLHLIAAEI